MQHHHLRHSYLTVSPPYKVRKPRAGRFHPPEAAHHLNLLHRSNLDGPLQRRNCKYESGKHAGASGRTAWGGKVGSQAKLCQAVIPRDCKDEAISSRSSQSSKEKTQLTAILPQPQMDLSQLSRLPPPPCSDVNFIYPAHNFRIGSVLKAITLSILTLCIGKKCYDGLHDGQGLALAGCKRIVQARNLTSI